ncbi:DUF5667 domain-containing protein [Chloroflexota bacterium]
MKNSREFDNVLDECLERLLFKGETLDQCLQSFPAHADELKSLLETALAARQASAIQPRPEFREKARAQFHSALRDMESKRSRSFFSWNWQPRWAMVTAVVLVLVLGGSGIVAAAGGSMPDEPLYAVKLATEQVRLVFTPSALDKAELYASLADKRVLEIVSMAGKNKPERIERTTRRLDDYLTKIAALSSAQEVTGGVAMAPAPRAASVPEKALEAEEALPVEEALVAPALTAKEAPVSEEAPVFAEASLPESAEGARDVRIKASDRASLKATVRRDADINSARLRALLETVPPSARPALLRAIAVSETGYQKALESLD